MNPLKISRIVAEDGLCADILLYMFDNEDPVDGFDFRDMKAALRAHEVLIAENLEYLRDKKVLDKQFHTSYGTREYIRDFLKKPRVSKSQEKRMRYLTR